MQPSNLNLSFLQGLINPLHADKIINKLQDINVKMESEFLLTINEKQLNDLLQQAVTKNVKQVLEMKVVCHDDWFRLTCIVSAKGIYAHIAADFKVVHIQLDRYKQRLVFAQQSETEILELHANSYLKKVALSKSLAIFKVLTKKDILCEIFERTKLAKIKDNVIYIDIGRWLRNNKSLMSNIQKVQVNYAYIASEQLIVKTNINPKNILQTTRKKHIITENDNPSNSTKVS